MLQTKGRHHEKSLLLLFLLTIGGGLNRAEAQSIPVRLGYAALSASYSPLWMAKELDLFERRGIQSTPIYMAATIAFVADFAFPLPATVIAELIGVPGQDRSRFRHWSQQLIMGLDSTQPNRVRAAAAVAVTQLLEYFRKLVTVRRGHPADDLLTALMAVEEAHDRLSVDELLGTCQLLLVAGHETTTNLIGTGLLRLIRHPDALEQLRSTPALLPSAIEELLRFESPVQQVRRVMLEDIEIGNTRIPRGQLVIVCLAAANRDPEVFDDPNRLNLGREPNPHLALGHGIHFCLGASLARLEAQIAFGCLLQRLTDIQLAGEPVWSSNKVIRGLRSLPIRYTMHH